MSRVLMHTDFPEPVEPAINRCGILAKSRTHISPSMLFPRIKGSLSRLRWNAGWRSASEKRTSSRSAFGTSRPITLFPGIGASTRTDPTARARARSFARFAIRLIFSPGAGSTSKRVTVGPRAQSTTRASRPKCESVSLMISARCLASACRSRAFAGLGSGGSRRSGLGRLSAVVGFTETPPAVSCAFAGGGGGGGGAGSGFGGGGASGASSGLGAAAAVASGSGGVTSRPRSRSSSRAWACCSAPAPSAHSTHRVQASARASRSSSRTSRSRHASSRASWAFHSASSPAAERRSASAARSAFRERRVSFSWMALNSSTSALRRSSRRSRRGVVGDRGAWRAPSQAWIREESPGFSAARRSASSAARASVNSSKRRRNPSRSAGSKVSGLLMKASRSACRAARARWSG